MDCGVGEMGPAFNSEIKKIRLLDTHQDFISSCHQQLEMESWWFVKAPHRRARSERFGIRRDGTAGTPVNIKKEGSSAETWSQP